MHVYQMRSSVPSVVATSQERINICMQALKDVSKAWLVAKMVYTLFDSILGNKALEERLQKAAGKRHQRVRQENNNNHNTAKRPDQPPKRKFDDMDLGLPNGGPTPPVSYERSRPQTPAATPSRELPPQQGQPSLGSMQTTPNAQRGPQEPFLGTGASRGNTRPTTPFNPPFSMPATPPDLFLVTRNSPNISQSLWENFQPDQLFPDGANIFPDLMSPQDNSVDPQLQMPSQLQNPDMQPGSMGMNQQPLAGRTPGGTQGSPTLVSGIPGGMGMQDQQQQSVFGLQNQQQWPVQSLDPSLGGAGMDHSSQDDAWSSSSRGQGPSVPTALNVEDWYVFDRSYAKK
ncbi:Transcriptional activator of fatty acid utilization [Paecilomyces lecythidis]